MEFISKFKQYLNENFGNSPEERWEYIQPKLVNLPDTPRAQTLTKGMKDAMMEDNKFEFDYYFVEAMKMLGLENELGDSEDDKITPPMPRNLTDRELANVFVRENDNVLDEIIKKGTMKDPVTKMMKEPLGAPSGNPYAEEPTMTDEEFEAIFGKNPGSDDDDDDDLDEIIKEGTWSLGSPEQIEDVIQSLQFDGVDKINYNANNKKWTALLYKVLGDDTFWDAYGNAQIAAKEENFYRAQDYLGDAIDRAQKLKTIALRNREVKGEVQTESVKKVLNASNDLEKALNDVSDELTDDQIASITDMILDLRDKVKAKLKK
jgi:hypothetical protein